MAVFCVALRAWPYLRVVELWQPRGAEAFWQLALDDHLLHLVAQQLVVDVARHGRLVHRKRLHSSLHPVVNEKRLYCQQNKIKVLYNYFFSQAFDFRYHHPMKVTK